jgi:hypothetical protein
VGEVIALRELRVVPPRRLELVAIRRPDAECCPLGPDAEPAAVLDGVRRWILGSMHDFCSAFEAGRMRAYIGGAVPD